MKLNKQQLSVLSLLIPFGLILLVVALNLESTLLITICYIIIVIGAISFGTLSSRTLK